MNNQVDSHLSNSISNITTTLGELVEALTTVALEVGKSEEEAYLLASLAVNDLLYRQRVDAEMLH